MASLSAGVQGNRLRATDWSTSHPIRCSESRGSVVLDGTAQDSALAVVREWRGKPWVTATHDWCW